MKKVLSGVAALAVAIGLMAGTAKEAKADGGVLLGIGIYLLADAVVGEVCHTDAWPLNTVRKVGRALHGRKPCRRHYGHRYHGRHHAHGHRHRHHHHHWFW